MTMMTIFMMSENPDYFDCNDPEDFDSYPDVYGFIEPDDYELCHDLHGPDDCGVYCAARGETGGSPYWICDAEPLLLYPGPNMTGCCSTPDQIR